MAAFCSGWFSITSRSCSTQPYSITFSTTFQFLPSLFSTNPLIAPVQALSALSCSNALVGSSASSCFRRVWTLEIIPLLTLIVRILSTKPKLFSSSRFSTATLFQLPFSLQSKLSINYPIFSSTPSQRSEFGSKANFFSNGLAAAQISGSF